MSIYDDMELKRTLGELGRYARNNRISEEKTPAGLFASSQSNTRPWFPLFEKQKDISASLLRQQFWMDEDGNNILSKPDLKYVLLVPIGKYKYVGNVNGDKLTDQRNNPDYHPLQGGICMDLITFAFGEFIIGGSFGEFNFVYRGKCRQFPEFHVFEPISPLTLYWGRKENFRWGGDDNPFPQFVGILNLRVEKTQN